MGSFGGVAGLIASEQLSDVAEWAVDKPLRILLIVVGALIVAQLSKRAIARAVAQAPATAPCGGG